MKSYELSATDLAQYKDLTDAEREAWLHPRSDSYHSLHVERMGKDTFRWRDSRQARFYVGTIAELGSYLLTLRLREIDPDYQSRATTINVLSDEEVAELFKDL